MQSEVRFHRVPEKVPVKVREALVQSQVRGNRVPEKVPEKVLEKVWETLVVARFRKPCKNRTLQLLGFPPKFFFFNIHFLPVCINLISFIYLYLLSCLPILSHFICLVRFSLSKLSIDLFS